MSQQEASSPDASPGRPADAPPEPHPAPDGPHLAPPEPHPAPPEPHTAPDEPGATGGETGTSGPGPSSAGEDSPPSGPSRRPVRQIMLGSMLALALAGAAVLARTAWGISTQKDATISTPAEVAGLRLDVSENAKTTADYLMTALSAEVKVDNAVGAVYTDPANQHRSVLFFGGTTLIWTPAADLDVAFGLISDNTGAMIGLHEVPAGKLGGTMKCGMTASPDDDLAVCGWADHGSLALAMFPNRSPDEAAPLLRTIRDAVQQRV